VAVPPYFANIHPVYYLHDAKHSPAGGDQMSSKKMPRRAAVLRLAGAAGAAAAAWACGGDTPTSPSGATTTTTGTTGASASTTVSTNEACATTPSETAGPYPSIVSIVRSDIRENRPGVPLTLALKVVNVNNGCAAVSGANVEIWHCDVSGNYSEYGSQTTQTYLRGIQTTDASGQVSFTTIYPGWYQGRATHIHIEVKVNSRSVKVTQIAFPESINNTVYASSVYASRGANPTSNLSDGIFADSLASELVTPVGDPASGYSASCQIGIAV
jgi:protocatechuate 3,4-dioxygenase beta subunit